MGGGQVGAGNCTRPQRPNLPQPDKWEKCWPMEAMQGGEEGSWRVGGRHHGLGEAVGGLAHAQTNLGEAAGPA